MTSFATAVSSETGVIERAAIPRRKGDQAKGVIFQQTGSGRPFCEMRTPGGAKVTLVPDDDVIVELGVPCNIMVVRDISRRQVERFAMLAVELLSEGSKETE